MKAGTLVGAMVVGVVGMGGLPSASGARGDGPGVDERELSTLRMGEAGEQIADLVRRSEGFGFSGAVLAAKGGEVVCATAVGPASLDGTERNTPATLFEIASASKQFTAAAVLRLVQQGKLGLDDPISRHLAGVPENCEAITIRHLLQHTSGIPGSNSRGAGMDVAAVLPFFLDGGPRHTPGKRFEYWNQGYALVTAIINSASGQDFVEYSRAEVFRPAGLRYTMFTGDDAPNVEGLTVAVGRSMRGGGKARSALEHPYGAFGFQYRGMGGVVTTVWDLWRWDRALSADGPDAILTSASKEELFKPGPGQESYALGWRVQFVHNWRVQSHGGAVRGFTCDARRYPDHDGCLFVLANRDDAPVTLVAAAIEAVLVAMGKSIELPEPLDAEQARELAGVYGDADGMRLTVAAAAPETRATIVWGNVGGAPVTRAFLGRDNDGRVVLFDWNTSEPMTIERDGQGGVQAIALSGRRLAKRE